MKVQVLETFKITNEYLLEQVKKLQRAKSNLDVKYYFYKGDTFQCSEELSNLLLNRNLIVVLKSEDLDSGLQQRSDNGLDEQPVEQTVKRSTYKPKKNKSKK